MASINYHLSQHAVYMGQIEDCKAAIRWLRANAAKYSLDAPRMAVSPRAHRVGGHLVAMPGTAGNVKRGEGKGGNPPIVLPSKPALRTSTRPLESFRG